ncbi:GM14466 [Drosophila sechellia]|uniref:GM14466 n=1 Tax=Drosophila sechellia TaxID=7238 RepID=B4HW53_DROSE|nr:GM14466 [Drosophila sechellia]
MRLPSMVDNVWKRFMAMLSLPDLLVLVCLWASGFSLGYYAKSAYVYDNLWPHWYALVGGLVALALTLGWTLRKHKKQQYSYDHYYIIFYGLLCSLMGSCFMLTRQLAVSYYFSFVGLSVQYLAGFSYVSLRCDASGSRPARIALANSLYAGGMATGFVIFNEMEPQRSGLIALGINLLLLCLVCLNELLHHTGCINYKESRDLVFNLLNEEKMLYIPFVLYSAGTSFGALLLMRYTPKLVYLLFGLIQITLIVALLCIYSDEQSEHCFLFLCLIYITMGVLSSQGIHWLLECSPFLHTELALAAGFVLQLCAMEGSKYESYATDTWIALIIVSVITQALTALAIPVVQWLQPHSASLVDVRNRLLGIRRQSLPPEQTQFWHTNHFLAHNKPANQLESVQLGRSRVFQQYPISGSDTAENHKGHKF